jgi:hypothetical protein
MASAVASLTTLVIVDEAGTLMVAPTEMQLTFVELALTI